MVQTAPMDDPNLKLPQAVRAAAARSDAYYNAQVTQQGNAQTPAVTGEPPGDSQTPAAPQQGTPPAAPGTPQPGVSFAGSASPGFVSSGQVPETGAPDSWENRYKAMKGRYDLSEQANTQFRARLENLESVLAATQAGAPQVTHAGNGQPPSEQRFVTPTEEQEFGTEFLDVVGRKAKEIVTPEVAYLRGEVDRLGKMIQGTSAAVHQNERERMYATMDAQVPGWRDINKSMEFKNWLALPDTYSGVIRHELLKDAHARCNTPQVIAFFNGFRAEEAAVAPAGNGSGQPLPNGGVPNGSGKTSLGDFAAPGRAKSAAGYEPPVEKPLITRAQISQFYSDVRRGVYRGRDDEKNRLEAMIYEATREGRIR